MHNMWLKVDKTNLKESLDLLVRDELLKIIIDGATVQSKILFMQELEKALLFPTSCAGNFSRFEDLIRDLSWIPELKGICIWITNYDEFMKEDKKNKRIFEEILIEEVLPFWENEVTKTVKGGKPREFYVIVS